MKSVFSKSSAGDSGLNVEIPRKEDKEMTI